MYWFHIWNKCNDTEASSDTIESEASVDSGADELQQKLQELAIAQDEPDQEAVVEDTGDEKSAVNQQSDGEGVFQEQDAKDDPCKDHKLQTEDDIQVDLSPSLTFDLSPSEEEPDMGHNVWRESIVYTSHRGQEIDKIEKKLEFGEEENIDAAETETKIEGDSTAPAVSEEPEETSEDCQPDTDTGAGALNVYSECDNVVVNIYFQAMMIMTPPMSLTTRRLKMYRRRKLIDAMRWTKASLHSLVLQQRQRKR